jgi:hypothetical protein
MRHFLLFTLLFLSQTIFSQISRTTYEVIPSENITHVNVQMDGDVVVERWTGDRVMIETKVDIYNASNSLVEFLIKEGRYELDKQPAGSSITLSNRKNNKAITIKGIMVSEILKQRVFVPEKMTFTQTKGDTPNTSTPAPEEAVAQSIPPTTEY